MAEAEPTPSMLRAQERATAVTKMQIEIALKLNAHYFDGEGLTNFPAILQALSTNVNAAVLHGKSMKT